MNKIQANEYQKGYAAGRKKHDGDRENEVRELKRQIAALEQNRLNQKERIFLSCLDTVTKNCKNWTVGGKEINDANGYCKLAKIFADHSIEILK